MKQNNIIDYNHFTQFLVGDNVKHLETFSRGSHGVSLSRKLDNTEYYVLYAWEEFAEFHKHIFTNYKEALTKYYDLLKDVEFRGGI